MSALVRRSSVGDRIGDLSHGDLQRIARPDRGEGRHRIIEADVFHAGSEVEAHTGAQILRHKKAVDEKFGHNQPVEGGRVVRRPAHDFHRTLSQRVYPHTDGFVLRCKRTAARRLKTGYLRPLSTFRFLLNCSGAWSVLDTIGARYCGAVSALQHGGKVVLPRVAGRIPFGHARIPCARPHDFGGDQQQNFPRRPRLVLIARHIRQRNGDAKSDLASRASHHHRHERAANSERFLSNECRAGRAGNLMTLSTSRRANGSWSIE